MAMAFAVAGPAHNLNLYRLAIYALFNAVEWPRSDVTGLYHMALI
jgi:hypothetical protein